AIVTANDSTAVGYNALLLDTGGSNIALGSQAGDNITSGASNIIIGMNIDAPSATASGQLSIGNLIFGTSLGETGTTISDGNVGIATTTPGAKLAIDMQSGAGIGFYLAGNSQSTADLFRISTSTASATSTAFIIDSNGKVGIGTTSPSVKLSIAGHCVTGDTRLRRRRRRRKNSKSQAPNPKQIPNSKSKISNETDGEWVYDEVAIKDIKPGDEIQSLDEQTGKIVWSRVNALMDMGVKPIYKFTTASGKTIRTTGNHPYLVRQNKNSKFGKPYDWKPFGRTLVMIDAANLEQSVKDKGWWVNYKKLKAYFSENTNLAAVRYYSANFATDSHNSFLTFLKKTGFALVTKFLKVIRNEAHDRKANFDVEISVDAILKLASFDTLVLFSGDSDFNYLVKILRRDFQKKVVVISSQDHVSSELIDACDIFIDVKKLRKDIERIERGTDVLKQNARPIGRAVDDDVSTANVSIGNSQNLSRSSVDNSLATARDGRWTKAAHISEGTEIAVASSDSPFGKGSTREAGGIYSPSGNAVWDTVVKIERLPDEQVYDIEVEGTHNFIAGHYVNARTRTALTLEQEARYVAWKEKSAQNKNTALLSDAFASRPAQRVWSDPVSVHSIHEASSLSTVVVDNCLLQPVEGIAPSGCELTRSLPHCATGLLSLYQLAVATAISELGFDPRDIEFGGIVAHNTYLSGGLGVGTVSTTTTGGLALSGTLDVRGTTA
ncbi:MAG: NYN domain-containing protein, partial [Patescibacteria group bacterium]